MTDPTDNRTSRQHGKSALAIAIAAATIVAPAGEGAWAQTKRAEPKITRDNARQDSARQDNARQGETASPDGVGPSSTVPEGPAPTAAAGGAESYGPTIGTTTLYGPPSPKAKRGDLPAIGWSNPAGQVPPALEEAVSIVTRNYPSAQSARAALRAAASDVKGAKWLRFPTVSGNLSYLDDSGSPEPQIVVEAPIWAGGRITANIRRAQAEEDASSAQYVETVQNLALTTTQTYFEIARLTVREQLLKESLAEHNRLVGTMERRVSQEVSPLADLELARSRAAQIEQDYNSTQAQRLTALRVLAQLVADPDYDLGPIPFYDPSVDLPDRDVLEEQAVAYNPTLDRLKSETDIARAQLDTSRAQILPQINAQYSYDNIFGSRVGVVLRSQTTGGLSQLSAVNSAALRIQSAMENVRVAEQELRRNVASDIIQYESSKARATISTSAASTATRVSESYMRQFIAGRRSWLDVMNALREAVTAEIAKSDAEFTAMATAAKLLLESGRWRPVFDEPAQ
ncbi:TolC family protein [Novosphingobium album (ex Liu et al. 2023)]|uniref:TolC family protein n=1 Tax=Novosphingobium album (ex Liu et al. 2023) TaxID=3031130 RepID=A0ABT5WS54_9SPHN|nr:TolC family protein [Novosphingobium album (ex Liu et al. 2023)]MDE8651823.1 TolC family protein [Novosphingobium album (ex Liu et al. 2023)]